MSTGTILLIVGFIALHFFMHRGHGAHGHGGGHGGHGGDGGQSGHGGGCCGGGASDEPEMADADSNEEHAHTHR